jgi:hypothetical protein
VNAREVLLALGIAFGAAGVSTLIWGALGAPPWLIAANALGTAGGGLVGAAWLGGRRR